MTNDQRRYAVRILRGAGQVPLWQALRISVGEALTTKTAHISTLIWGCAYGIISMSWCSPNERPVVFVMCLVIAATFGYGSSLPWRWRLVRRGSPWFLIFPVNGALALLMGLGVFFVAVSFIKLLTIGAAAFSDRQLLNTAWGSLYGFQFPVIGFYITYATDQAHREHIQRKEKVRFENVASQARLIALRSQINPHFFFNALNTIAALIPQRPEDAERAVELLATALRPVLTREQAMLATLESELLVAQAYAQIEQLRFGDRCNFIFNISEDAKSCLLPSLTLQPLLENAVRHGAARCAGAYTIELQATTPDGSLHIIIKNGPDDFASTPGAMKPIAFPAEHALHNISQRLRMLFGKEATLNVMHACGNAGVALLEVPQTTTGFAS